MLKIVCIGGGTGLYTLLRGLKKYPCEITAIVSMADDGGCSGKLRDEYGILPPGDVRRCLIALSDSTELMKKIFGYRFNRGSLKDYSLGNIILTALREIENSDVNGIKRACELLKIKGNVLPCTQENIRLCAELENGKTIYGETNIDIPKHNPNLKIRKVFLDHSAQIFKESKEALLDADIITIGPGDLYTSLIPNLLVSGFSETIKNSNASLIYICNIMTKHGETDNFKVGDFVSEITKYAGKIPDYVFYDTSKINDKILLEKYEKEQAFHVKLNHISENSRVIGFDFVKNSTILRHDSDILAKAVIKMGEELPESVKLIREELP